VSRIRTRFGAAMAGALIGALLLATPAAAVTPITFQVYVNGTCQYGTGQASTAFTVRLLDSNGDLIQRMNATSNASGSWYACFSVPGTPGFKVRATGGGVDRTVTIRNLTMKVNRVTDVVSGHWAGSTSLDICITHYTSFTTSSYLCLGGTSASNGSYSIDFTPEFNVRGGDNASATYTSGSDTFSVNTTTPYMTVTRGRAYVEGYVNRGSVETLTLRDAGSTLRGSLMFQGDNDGYFDGYLQSAGTLVLPRVTDKVIGSFASDAMVTVPNIVVTGVASTNVVSGTCMPNRPYNLYARRADYSDSIQRYGTTDGSGHFSQDLTADINLLNGDPLQLTCMFPDGDRITGLGYVTT
jgi:hypothetical protein